MSARLASALVPAVRRKPQQSRARHTAQALREAFVRLLVERGFDAITIREVVAVAGTGLGSFYEYFASKNDLAMVCLHLRSKALLVAMRASVVGQPPRPLTDVVNALVEALLQAHASDPQAWGAHYTLERHLSPREAYSKMYDRFVAQWAMALETATDIAPQTAESLRQAARVSHTITYGLFAHTFIAGQGQPDLLQLGWQTRTAVLAYLRAVVTTLESPSKPHI
jgi:AcrR family transcriptional regulator